MVHTITIGRSKFFRKSNFQKYINIYIFHGFYLSYPKITTKRITAGGGSETSEDIFIALSSLNICRISCGTFSFSLQTKVQGQHRSEVSFKKIFAEIFGENRIVRESFEILPMCDFRLFQYQSVRMNQCQLVTKMV